MDDLLALMEEGEDLPSDDVAVQSSPSSSSPQATTVSNESPNDVSRKNKKKKRSVAEMAETKIDHQLKIRLMDRKIGSLHLLELIQTQNYQSPSSLASMSLASLNGHLIEPAESIGAANVCGNTNLLTIGLVFSNSGTKIAAKGNAFCILQIGSDIPRGPTVSVLLFGPAYSKYCNTIKPGLVIGLENPRLIPPKPKRNSKFQDMPISFSITEERRLFVIARASDYGVCPAPMRGKNAEGRWVSNARRCLAAIDNRAGKYCYLHRNQDAANCNGNSKTGKKMTFIQQQKQELNIQPLRKNGVLVLPNNKKGGRPAVSGRLQGVNMHMNKLQAPSQQLTLNHGLRRPVHSSRPTNNSILNSGQQRTMIQPRADSLVRPAPHANPKLTNNRLLNPNMKENPYNAKRTSNSSINKPQSNASTKGKFKSTETTGRKQATANKLNKASAMDGSLSFDGQVAVPKPNRLFSTSASRSSSMKRNINKNDQTKEVGKRTKLATSKSTQQGSWPLDSADLKRFQSNRFS